MSSCFILWLFLFYLLIKKQQTHDTSVCNCSNWLDRSTLIISLRYCSLSIFCISYRDTHRINLEDVLSSDRIVNIYNDSRKSSNEYRWSFLLTFSHVCIVTIYTHELSPGIVAIIILYASSTSSLGSFAHYSLSFIHGVNEVFSSVLKGAFLFIDLSHNNVQICCCS